MYIVPSTETHFFLGGWEGRRLFEGGRLLQILNLRRGANSKQGAYLKLGANSSIYGILKGSWQVPMRSCQNQQDPVQYLTGPWQGLHSILWELAQDP